MEPAIDFGRLAKILDDADVATQKLADAQAELDDARREIARIGDGRPPHPVPGVQFPPDPSVIAERTRIEATIPHLKSTVERLTADIEHIRAMRARAIEHAKGSGAVLPASINRRIS